MLLFSVFPPMNEALAATPASLITNVTVDGIDEGGIIDGSTEVKIKVVFGVPVMGDGVDDFYEHDDVVTLELSKSFNFDPVPDPDSIELFHGDGENAKKLGTVTLFNDGDKAMATIKFDGDEDIFDPGKVDGPPYSDVTGEFEVSLKYNGTYEEDEEGNKTVSILEKTYLLQLPGDIITYTVEKSAEGAAVNLDEGEIEWTVTITAQSGVEPATNIDLEGYMFEDDLKNVGEYVGDSFKLNSVELGDDDSNLVVPDSLAEPATTKLVYTFPEGSVSPQTIKFKTEISDSMLTAGGSITNGAYLYLDGDEVGFDDFEVTISKPGVSKSGEANDPSSDTEYNPEDRTITWYVKVDNEGRTLDDLTIIDELKGGLIFQSAQWQRWNSNDEDWDDVTGISWSMKPADNKYSIGDGVNYVGRLKIVTEVPDGTTDGSVVRITYNNQATVTWSGSGGTTGSAITGNPGVGIGYDAISKGGSQSSDDVKNHQITWTIKVEMKGQSPTDFKVYDLFVHDKNTSNSAITGTALWPEGLTIGSTGVTRNDGQKYIDVSSNVNNLRVNPIDLKKDGKTIATLVEITDLKANGNNEIVLKSQVIDPDIIAGNVHNQRVYNYASLYKNTVYRGGDNAYVNYNNKILAKELLKRAEVDNDYSVDADINANNRTISAADGFHYSYKEAIFRLNVNGAGVDFKDVETNLTESEGFGDVVVRDTLPEGWEFTKFSNGQDYLIYETTVTLNTGDGYPATGSLETSGSALGSVTGLTASFDKESDPQAATFTFTNLDKPYVILVKAKPSDETFDDYLVNIDTRNERNTLMLNSLNWESGKSVWQDVKVDSRILQKTLDLTEHNKGILTWIVEYTPFEREIGTGLEDTIPQGIDLRTDSGGQLIWEQEGSRNINVYKMSLKDDGSGDYVDGDELDLEVLKSAVSYDNDTRKLTFTFPDEAQAYKLTYATDITGTPGLVTNAVKLLGADGEGTGKDESFEILEQHGAATMGRSGFLIVKKTDMNSDPLSGAEFTLYNTNEDGTKGSSRAVRTTAGDGTVKFYGLAPGNYILVETESPADYENSSLEYNVAVGDDLKTTVNGSVQITGSNPFAVVNYKATDEVGSLTIRKEVAGDGADTAKIFDFILTLNGAPGNYTYVGHGVPGGTITSGDTVSLAHGESITIIGLPSDATYTVTEADYSGDGYTGTSVGETGTIDTNTTKVSEFVNTRTVGSLVIAKTVAGNAGDRSKAFEFILTLEGAADIPYAYIGNGVPDGTIQSGDTISLTHGQSITITDLPAGTTYTVTEEDYSDDGYTTVSTGEAGEIETDAVQTAAFTNSKSVSSSSSNTGNLTISKTVAGDDTDTTKKFDFTITLSGALGTYNYTGNGVPNGTIRSGDTISLAHGESITITGLPVGATYKVAEENSSSQGYIVESTGSSGTISASRERTAAFTNTKLQIGTGSLTISKAVAGQDADFAKKFDFTVNFTGASLSYNYTGNGVQSGTIKSGDTISLAHGESITITGLPAGTQYTVIEADYSNEGYKVTSRGSVGTITANSSQTAAFTNNHGDEPVTLGSPEDPEYNLGDDGTPQGSTNVGKDGMPKTGDNQTSVLATLGLIFFSLALMALIIADFTLRRKFSR